MEEEIACVASIFMWFRSKERGTRVKDRAKNGASKRAGRGWARKEGNACRQTLGFWKPIHLACHAWVCAPTFDAVISCQNWPIKSLAFCEAEMNFRGRMHETKLIFFVFWYAWTASMLKSQWIQTINAGCTRSKLCQTERLTVLTMAQTTRVALVKASKNEANPATDEVHVENRNYGFAWGNNRTVAIQKLLPINHCSISSLYWVTMQFSIVDVTSV